MTDRSMAPVGQALLDAFEPPFDLGDTAIDFVVHPGSAIDGVAVTVDNASSGAAYLVYVTPGLASLTGYAKGELVGQPLTILLDEVDDDRAGAQLATIVDELADGVTEMETSMVLRHRSGRAIAAHITHCAVPSSKSGPRYRLLLVRDVSRASVERLVADQAPVIDSLARGSDLGALCHEVASRVEAQLTDGRCWVGVTDLHDRLEAVVTGGHDPELVGRLLRLTLGIGDPSSPRCVFVDNLPPSLADPLAGAGYKSLWAFPALDDDEGVRGAIVVVNRRALMPSDGEVRLLDHLSEVVATGIGRASLEATMAHRALHDPLTGLPNRALIVDRLQQAMSRLDREPASLSVLLVDIDRFKSLNDTWGTEVGDRVLLEVAGRLLGSVRLGDTVGRVSSDQFLMICTGGADFDPSVVARRVIGSMKEPVRLGTGDELRISASIGVVMVADAEGSPNAIVGNAESAVAKAVESGRGGFALFDEGLQQKALARQATEQALHAAIAGDELVLHYQPVCEVSTGRMVGAEALVRWDRPGHGLLGPGDFIDIAEDTGLIIPLGAWVIADAARSLARWPKAADGRWPVVTVNLSARQLADEGLVPMVSETLAANDLPPTRMGFEVTESMQVDDFEAAIETLDALAALGCRIAIDDFGIGYATLDYLRRFSMADVIKVDRSFVAGLGRSREDTAIVSASVALAKALRMQVVAEGVETELQLGRLRKLGCHFAQGFALSAPVSLAAAIELWRGGPLLARSPMGGAIGGLASNR